MLKEIYEKFDQFQTYPENALRSLFSTLMNFYLKKLTFLMSVKFKF